MDHERLLRMLKERIDDAAFLNLIRKWLKAGIPDTDGMVRLIYFWDVPEDRIYMLLIYKKAQARGSHPESTQNTPKSCKGVAKMKENDFNNLFITHL